MADYRLSYPGAEIDTLLGQVRAKPVTYSALKTLRDGGNLAGGCFYRITDFVTTTADSESRSVGNQYDVLVLAIDTNHLSEEAYAAHHTGDSYFTNSKLDAWRLWYCLDNDTSRFGWADSTNGKGVVYRMIDEYDNDLPYDFKNIQFKRYAVTAESQYTASLGQLNGLRIGHPSTKGVTLDTASYYWYYTFSWMGASWGSCTDGTLTGKAYNNIFLAYRPTGPSVLLNNVFANGDIVQTLITTTLGLTLYDNSTTTVADRNTFESCCNNITSIGFYGINVGHAPVRRNLHVGVTRHNVFKTDTQDNTVVGEMCFNTAQFDNNVMYLIRPFSRNIMERVSENYIYVNGVVACNKGVRFMNNSIVVTTYTENMIWGNNFGVSFSRNTISSPFCYNTVHYNCSDNTFAAAINGCDFDNIQCKYNEVNSSCIATKFNGILEYTIIPAKAGYSFSYNQVGPLRGTSSAKIKLGNDNFYVSAVSGIKRKVVIEGTTNNEIVATWKGTHGATVGVYATQAESVAGTWHNI